MAGSSRKSTVKAKKTAVSKAGTKPRATRPVAAKAKPRSRGKHGELIIITGMSGSGKLSSLKAFEDLGYYAVDNLPIELIPQFADLILQSDEIERAALVVDVRESSRLDRFPAVVKSLRQRMNVLVIFLEAADDVLVRRFSETRRPHPIGRACPAHSFLPRRLRVNHACAAP